jgi:glyoxylase-like metal-dependent hydrolase (beta-lactamase superfamily II)
MNGKIKTIELDFVNAYLLAAGDGFILIDTGMPCHWERLQAELKSAGCRPEKLKLVIITHADRDHTGNCARLQKEYQAKIAIHPDDAAMALTGISPKRRVRSWRAKLRLMLFKLRKPAYDTFKPDVLLGDGQSLQGYGLQAKIIHIPGHTKGSIAVLTEEGELFVGDTLVNTKQPDTATYIENPAELQASVAKLKALKVSKVYTGHGKPFLMEQLPG